MPPLLIRCVCGKAITVAARHRGRQIRCRECGRGITVPPPPHGVEGWVAEAGLWAKQAALAIARLSDRLTTRGPTTPAPPRRRKKAVAAPNRWDLLISRLSWGYLAATFLVAILLWRFSDVWWPATILLFIGRWIFLLPLVVLVPAAVMYRRGMLTPLALGALIVVFPIMGFRTGWRRMNPHATGEHVRVVTFNVDGGDFIVPLLPDLLAEWEPDVVAFQECGELLTEAIRRLPNWHHHDVRALCFLSRYPILDSLVMDRSGLEIVAENEKSGIGGSGDVARYSVQLPQGVASFTNLHLETPRKGLEGLRSGAFRLSQLQGNIELRQIESDLARKWVDAGKGPSLVMGDFNTPVESRIFQRSWGSLTDAFSYAGFGLGATRDNGWIKARIDHVLTGPGWYPDHVTVGRDLGSDHWPVIADLTLVPR